MDKKMEYTTIQISEGEVKVVTREMAEQAIAEEEFYSLFSSAWYGAEWCDKDGDENYRGLAILDLERGSVVSGFELEDGSRGWFEDQKWKSLATKVNVYVLPQDVYELTHPDTYETRDENAESEMMDFRREALEALDRIYGKKA